MPESAEVGPEQPKDIALVNWDSRGPQTEDNVASFTIMDPEKPGSRNKYCIGFKFLGGELTDPSNWTYNHTNYWDIDAQDPDEVEIDDVPVEREQVEALLERYDTTPDQLLTQYCEKLKAMPPEK